MPREVYRKMDSLGFFGLRYPEKYGGSNLDAVASVVLWEELAKSGYASSAGPLPTRAWWSA